MKGDIIYVERKPLLWRSTQERRNPNSGRMDSVIFRTTKYRHFGIDRGDGTVIHFQGDSIWTRSESEIVISTMEEFVKDGVLCIEEEIPYEYSHDEVVERAEAFLGTRFGGYSIANNNCEHFVMWCATDLRKSRQAILLSYGIKMVGYPKRILDFVYGTIR